MKNLKKKLKTFYKKNTALVFVVLFALIIGLPTVAYNTFDEDVKNLIADKYLEIKIGTGEIALGAITMDKSTFDHGIEILSEGLDITGGDLNVDGTSDFSAAVVISGDVTMSGANTISATTTLRYLDATLSTDLSWVGGTTTPGGGETTVVTVAEIENTGADLLCNDVWLDLSTARGSFSGLFAVGTTTATGDVSLIATSTASLIAETALATTTTDIFNKEDEAGTWDTEVFIWGNGEILTASDTFTTGNATSAADFTAEGGFTGVGTLNVNCRTRY